jgi:hypothetical protein
MHEEMGKNIEKTALFNIDEDTKNILHFEDFI